MRNGRKSCILKTRMPQEAAHEIAFAALEDSLANGENKCKSAALRRLILLGSVMHFELRESGSDDPHVMYKPYRRSRAHRADTNGSQPAAGPLNSTHAPNRVHEDTRTRSIPEVSPSATSGFADSPADAIGAPLKDSASNALAKLKGLAVSTTVAIKDE